jgi:hypothetical protein
MKNLSLFLLLSLTVIISACGDKSSTSVNGTALEPVIISPLKEDLEAKINNFLKQSDLTKNNKIQIIALTDNQTIKELIFNRNGSLNSRAYVNMSHQARSQFLAKTDMGHCLAQDNLVETIVAIDVNKIKLYKRDLTAPIIVDPKKECKNITIRPFKDVLVDSTSKYTDYDPTRWSGAFYLAKLQGKDVFVRYIAQSKKNSEIIEIYSPELSLIHNPTLFIQRKRDTGADLILFIETNTAYSDMYVAPSEYEDVEINDTTL